MEVKKSEEVIYNIPEKKDESRSNNTELDVPKNHLKPRMYQTPSEESEVKNKSNLEHL